MATFSLQGKFEGQEYFISVISFIKKDHASRLFRVNFDKLKISDFDGTFHMETYVSKPQKALL